MAAEKKAGIPFVVKVNTKADQFGKESTFKMHYFNDTTQTVTDIADPFFEFTKTIVATATTVVGAITAGTTVIPVASVVGFTVGETVELGGVFYRLSAVGASDLTLKRGVEGAIADATALNLSGKTGTYGCSVTVPNAGDYTFHITNYDIGMDNEPAPVEVSDATVDDVKLLLDTVGSEVNSIKAQVDLLDEVTLNNLDEQVTSLATNLDSVYTLLKDTSDVFITVNGDETANTAVGATVTGGTSGATGIVQYSTYDATTDVTSVTLQTVAGVFVTGETLNDGTNTTVGVIQTVANNVINSVIEFVQEIDTLLKSSTGLDALSDLNKDLEAMLRGDAFLSDGVTANPTSGKAFVAIFDELVATHTDLTTLKTLAEDATNGFAAIKTSVVDARASLESKLAQLIDEGDVTSLASKLNAVKTVVDANSAVLGDVTFGNAAIKTAIDDVSALFATGGTAELRFTAIDTAISTLSTSLDDQTTYLTSRFDAIDAVLQANNDATNYTVFA